MVVAVVREDTVGYIAVLGRTTSSVFKLPVSALPRLLTIVKLSIVLHATGVGYTRILVQL